MAGRNTAEFSPQVRKKVRLVLANALDDCFATGDVAAWVAFNCECINDQVLATIRLLDKFCEPNGKIDFKCAHRNCSLRLTISKDKGIQYYSRSV